MKYSLKHSIGHPLLLLIAIGTLFVVALVYGYMWHTTSASIGESLMARQAVLSAASSNSHDQTFMQMYQSTADSWSKLPSLFVGPNNVVSFIEAVESLGSGVGATTTISSIDADDLENTAPGTMGTIRAHVEVQGSWSAVIRTLELAEIMPYKVTVSRVSLNSSGSSNGGRQYWRLGFDIKAAMMTGLSVNDHNATSTPAPASTSTSRSQPLKLI